MNASLQVTAAAATHVGKVREMNEDAFHLGDTVHAVADGMGGHAAGEIASAIAVQHIADLERAGLPGDVAGATRALAATVAEANRAVLADAAADPEHDGMGTTLTAVAVVEGQLVIAHVGDSRAYLIRDAEARQLTIDHATGPYTLTRAIGTDDDLEVDTYGPEALADGDVVILCSDGLTAVIDGAELPQLAVADDPREIARVLVAETLERGAPDNVAVVVLRVRN